MRHATSIFLLASTCLGGCDAGPPLETLPLRDALGADPAVIARLDEASRRALAQRMEVERRRRTVSEVLPIAPGGDARARIGAVDQLLRARGRDALLVVELVDGPGGVALHPVPDEVRAGDGPPLPELASATVGETKSDEARALAGAAGDALRALVAATGARRIERVTGWAVAAVVVGDVLYVNAAWLVALAPPLLDGGVPLATSATATATANRGGVTVAPWQPAASGASDALDGGVDAATRRTVLPASDPGAADLGPSPSPQPAPAPPPDVALEVCAGCTEACAGATCAGAGSGDCASDGESCDDCSGSSCGSDDCSCPDDASAAARDRRSRASPFTTRAAWIGAPLVFLLFARRRRRP